MLLDYVFSRASMAVAATVYGLVNEILESTLILFVYGEIISQFKI